MKYKTNLLEDGYLDIGTHDSEFTGVSPDWYVISTEFTGP